MDSNERFITLSQSEYNRLLEDSIRLNMIRNSIKCEIDAKPMTSFYCNDKEILMLAGMVEYQIEAMAREKERIAQKVEDEDA